MCIYKKHENKKSWAGSTQELTSLLSCFKLWWPVKFTSRAWRHSTFCFLLPCKRYSVVHCTWTQEFYLSILANSSWWHCSPWIWSNYFKCSLSLSSQDFEVETSLLCNLLWSSTSLGLSWVYCKKCNWVFHSCCLFQHLLLFDIPFVKKWPLLYKYQVLSHHIGILWLGLGILWYTYSFKIIPNAEC